MSQDNDRIVVGMSGGVDSTVAAALLKRKGYQVIGVMLRLWSDPGTLNRCCAPEAVSEARQAAGQLDIPFYAMDAKDAFYQAVVEPFISGYARGITPNPCLCCNRMIRWKFLRSRAKALGADKIATGHYARTRTLPDGQVQLLMNPDPNKDQSYFLHVLTQEDLQHTVFPLADLTKPQVRQLARDFSLTAAERPDSQDLCFVGRGDYRDFLDRTVPSSSEPGPILDQHGNQLGEHSGLAHFTIGQRKGLRIAGKEPYYVIQKNPQNNSLIVGYKKELGRTEFSTQKANWISGQAPDEPIQARIRIRYKSPAVPGWVTPLENGATAVKLDDPLPDITPGQAAVFYHDQVCLGGGIIRREDT